jgi:NAD(P)-dependent dehydrogenase (short-subunit alcohol dehydrogenase family)
MLEKFRLDGKVAVVTGASKNIGLEIARELAQAGATVVMVARDGERLRERAAQVRAGTDQRIEACPADVGNPADVERLLAFVNERFDQADVLVNNAKADGATVGVPPLSIPASAWAETFAVNVIGPYQLTAGLGQAMSAGRGGSVINILSGSGFLPMPGLLCYGATKAAMWTMTKYLAAELAPAIRVNAVCPGLTMSDTGGPNPDRPNVALAASLAPMQRAAHPTEVAPAVLYLASAASSYTTGAVIVVNGGRPWN